ncbi:hypothetical protein SAMN05444158_2312 [Bradyrhizobium canariense]|jgi:hypothetical protein|uniref:Uncharacterized protein n=1 Tax=Bradyrhizobium canariense TaxID=255045 RepID=A0A1H1SVZ2_9BRAD|nr:hypothetical protein SAMN05444158_2312 [Bradyrhizobium canariense]
MRNVSVVPGKSSRTGAFLGWIRALVSKSADLDELRRVNRGELEQIARDLILSPRDLYALLENNFPRDLLKERLAEFELSPAAVKARHPDVFHDLQRVCGNCPSTKRCAGEFAQQDHGLHRSSYCPNTPTLQALKQENLESNARASLPIGPCCC